MSTFQRGEKITVEGESSLLDFLRLKLKDRSVTSIKELLKKRCICVNDQVVTRFDHPLKPNDIVCVGQKKDARYGFEHSRVSLLYEDDFILVINKSSGLHSVDTTGKGVENAFSIMENYIRKRDSRKRLYIVHRLDRDTSGVMLFAKNREAQNKLVSNWNETIEERNYYAVVEGSPEPPCGTIDSYLYEDSHKVMHSTRDSTKGLRAVTHYETVCTNGRYSLLCVNLDTGRTNQIRVQMQSIGHPVVGDGKYGAEDDPLGRLGLHAGTIRFRHPIFHKMMSFRVEMPEEFESVCR